MMQKACGTSSEALLEGYWKALCFHLVPFGAKTFPTHLDLHLRLSGTCSERNLLAHLQPVPGGFGSAASCLQFRGHESCSAPDMNLSLQEGLQGQATPANISHGSVLPLIPMPMGVWYVGVQAWFSWNCLIAVTFSTSAWLHLAIFKALTSFNT